MAEYIIQDSTLSSIADAIRTKTGKTDEILVSNMATEITNISTGAELNFDVVGGTTQPSNPTENAIWVNTNVGITSWVFSATVPSNPIEGMVHFTTSSAAVAEFNALSENDIRVYPTGCSQYVGGTWVSKDAKTYQNGQWLSWILYLYKKGTFYEIAGTMTQRGVKKSSDLTGNVPGINGTCTISTGSTSM